MFNKIRKEDNKKLKQRQAKLDNVINSIMDIVEEKNVNLTEMADVVVNLQNNFNKTILEQLKEKQDEQ